MLDILEEVGIKYVESRNKKEVTEADNRKVIQQAHPYCITFLFSF